MAVYNCGSTTTISSPKTPQFQILNTNVILNLTHAMELVDLVKIGERFNVKLIMIAIAMLI